jgi:hypothetical protein
MAGGGAGVRLATVSLVRSSCSQRTGNRFGLPAYYSLYAWIWKHNPSGTFNLWNPTVKCGMPVSSADDVSSMDAPEGDW